MAKISDILAHKGSEVHRIAPDASVYDAIAAMSEHGVGALLVVTGAGIDGIITERDYLRKIALEGRSSQDTPVRAIMTGEVLYVEPWHEVEEALAIMIEARIRHLPVMSDGELAGLVSIGDCVKQVSRERKAQLRYMTDYIQDKYPG